MSKTMFVKDNFYVDGTILCKYISSKYTEEQKKTTEKDKLKFELVDDQINNEILDYFRKKELYFLKNTMKSTEIKFPLRVKSFLSDSTEILISNVNEENDKIIITRQYLEKSEESEILSDKIKNICLKFNLADMEIKNIKGTSAINKLSLNDLIELVKSEHLKLKIRVKCGAVLKDNILYISGSLVKISLEGSKKEQIYTELKEKSSEKNVSLLPQGNIYISKYPTKAKKITNNIVNILMQENNNESNKKKVIN